MAAILSRGRWVEDISDIVSECDQEVLYLSDTKPYPIYDMRKLFCVFIYFCRPCEYGW